MKVGDLVVFIGPKMDDPKQFGIVLSEHTPSAGRMRVLRIYLPHFDEHLNGWEEEYRVVSSNESR